MRAITFGWFAFAMLWFWSTWPQLGAFVAVLGAGGIALAIVLTIAAAAPILTVVVFIRLRMRSFNAVLSSPYMRTAWCTLLAAGVISVEVLFNSPAPHIVYKAF